MQTVRELRASGIPCYFTMDAGPNVKVLVEKKNQTAVQAKFIELFSRQQVILAHAGQGITIIE